MKTKPFPHKKKPWAFWASWIFPLSKMVHKSSQIVNCPVLYVLTASGEPTWQWKIYLLRSEKNSSMLCIDMGILHCLVNSPECLQSGFFRRCAIGILDPGVHGVEASIPTVLLEGLVNGHHETDSRSRRQSGPLHHNTSSLSMPGITNNFHLGPQAMDGWYIR